jgi:hypothetical protein
VFVAETPEGRQEFKLQKCNEVIGTMVFFPEQGLRGAQTTADYADILIL